MINIGIPSKGRLRKDILKIFSKNSLQLISERGERDLLGSVKGYKKINITYQSNTISKGRARFFVTQQRWAREWTR